MIERLPATPANHLVGNLPVAHMAIPLQWDERDSANAGLHLFKFYEQYSEELTAAAQLSMEAGKWEQARSLYDSATHLNPANSEAFWGLAVALAYQGEVCGSLKAINRCLWLTPDFALAFATRAVIYRAMGRLDHAIADLDRACEFPVDPAVGKTWRNLAFNLRIAACNS